MDKELIRRLAREAGMFANMPWCAEQTIYCISLEQQAAFAALIAEECAKVAESLDDAECDTGYGKTQYDAAEAIRERFKP